MTLRRCAPLVLAALLACRGPDETVPRAAAGEAMLRWRDSTAPGEFSAPGVAVWCEQRKELLVTAQRADTGVAVLLVFDGPAAVGRLAVRTDGLPPRASVALRLADRSTLRAWRADSGTVNLETIGASVRLQVGVRAATVQADNLAPLRVTGTLADIPIVPDSACARAAPVLPAAPLALSP